MKKLFSTLLIVFVAGLMTDSFIRFLVKAWEDTLHDYSAYVRVIAVNHTTLSNEFSRSIPCEDVGTNEHLFGWCFETTNFPTVARTEIEFGNGTNVLFRIISQKEIPVMINTLTSGWHKSEWIFYNEGSYLEVL